MGKPVAARGTGRERVLAAAAALFIEKGIDRSSLQMIADHLGVAKAAVYYQFQNKDDIVRALLDPVLTDMTRLVDQAETGSSSVDRSESAATGLVELVVRHRRLAAVFDGDPVVQRLIRSDEALAATQERLSVLLNGPYPDPVRRVAVSVASSGMMHAAANDRLRDVDDATLRALLTRTTRLLLALDEHDDDKT